MGAALIVHVSERPETGVTNRTEHIGNTFRPGGGVDALEGVFGDSQTIALRGPAARGRGYERRSAGQRCFLW
jgi:hypothetical protein